MNIELTIKGTVESLHLEPGDSLIVTVEEPARINADIVSHIRNQFQAEFPDHKVIILSPGLGISKAAAA